VNLSGRLNVVDGFNEWDCIETPGHTMGHVAFYRHEDAVLLAGDALTTMNLDSAIDSITRRPRICRPPVPATMDWEKARCSVELLASLRPRAIGAGHGPPIMNAADELERFAAAFTPPPYGRYVKEPVQADELGITYLPPWRTL